MDVNHALKSKASGILYKIRCECKNSSYIVYTLGFYIELHLCLLSHTLAISCLLLLRIKLNLCEQVPMKKRTMCEKVCEHTLL